MKKKVKALLKNNKGAAFLLMAFVALFIFIVFMATIEILKVFSVAYNVQTQMVRLVNNAVETNIDDEYRIDGYNQLTGKTAEIAVENAIKTFKGSFYDYTQSSGGSDPAWAITASPNGVINGSCYASSGEFLYMIDIEAIDGNAGGLLSGGDPSLYCAGTLYIANSIPGLMNTFVFKIPLSIKSTNFRINDAPDVNLGGGETSGS